MEIKISDLNDIHWCIGTFEVFNEKFKNEYAKNTYDWECYKTNKNIISHARKAYDNIKKHE